MGTIGIILLLIGVAGMDSESLVVPIALVIIGLAMVFIEGRRSEKSVTDYTNNHTTTHSRY